MRVLLEPSYDVRFVSVAQCKYVSGRLVCFHHTALENQTSGQSKKLHKANGKKVLATLLGNDEVESLF